MCIFIIIFILIIIIICCFHQLLSILLSMLFEYIFLFLIGHLSILPLLEVLQSSQRVEERRYILTWIVKVGLKSLNLVS